MAAEEQQLLRIGTGGSGGTYFPIGSLIAEYLTENNQGIDLRGSDTELVAIAQRSSGSVANVNDISNKLLESGLAQADVAHWAYHGIGPFKQYEAMTNLRVLATLYFESLHLVAHVDSGIGTVADLIDHRVSVDEVGSGTELLVRPVLDAFGISKDKLKMVFLKPEDSIERLKSGELDAFFIVAGYPVSGVSELIEEGMATLIPISGPELNTLLEVGPFLTISSFPTDTYSNALSIPTLAVAAQWIIDEEMSDELVFNITQMLWSDESQKMLTEGHQRGGDIKIITALKGIGIPLHPGALRYYELIGLSVTDLPY